MDKAGETVLAASDDWWESQERVCQVISPDEVTQVGPRTSCSCQVRYDPSYL